MPQRQPLSRILDIAEIPATGADVHVMATEAERNALAKACGLSGIEHLEASFQVGERHFGCYQVTGRLEARVRQICVISLDPFESSLSTEINVTFADEPSRLPVLGDEDPPDPLTGGKIDLGALAAEFLALNIDDYPRKPGVTFEGIQYSGGQPEAKSGISPFEVLRKLS